jgi:REP element-mobilizing transposase RayT
MQAGKTRRARDSTACHLAWIPMYRRTILTGDVQKATKELMSECCERHDLTLLAL